MYAAGKKKQESQEGERGSSSQTAPATSTPTVEVNSNMEAAAPAAPTPTEKVNQNKESDAPAAESATSEHT